ncbi:MAG: flippase-like domain-containing protein [Phycisphaerales bacterium]|nr:flippase-like domain-containing protein [Phycisphaerales bacterium]MCB9864320.1 flippase-like domain-containing protein [Phycisphaerales bacterium]
MARQMTNPSVDPRIFSVGPKRYPTTQSTSTVRFLRPVMIIVLRIAITGAVVGWIVWKVFWDQSPVRHNDNDAAVTTLILRANHLWLLACVGALALHALLMVIRWNLALATLGVKPDHRWATITWARSQVVSLLPTNQLGADAYRARCIHKRISGILAPLAVVILERSVGIIALITLAAIAAPLSGYLGTVNISFDGVATAVLGVFAGIVCFGLIAGPINRRWRLSHRFARLASLYAQDSAQQRLVALAFFVSIAAHAVLSTSHWCVDRALNLGTPVSCYLLAIPLTGIACLVPVHIAGIGVSEASLFYLLGAMAGRTMTEVVALSVLARLGSLVMVSLYSLAYLVSSRPKVHVNADSPSTL